MIDIDKLISKAQKEHNNLELNVYRAIKAEIINFKTAKHAKLYDEKAEIKLLQKMVKQRNDSISQYKQAGRDDLATNECNELEIINKLLPKPTTSLEIENWLIEWCTKQKFYKEFLTKYEYYVPKSMTGRVISLIKDHFLNVDGKLVSDIVKEFVSNEKLCI